MSRIPLSIGRLSNLVGYHLRRASGLFALDFRVALEGTGMRQVLVGILAVVEANPGIGQGAAGTALGIKRANMVSLINELVDRGLIDRVVTPEDRRAFSLSLTASGTAMLTDCAMRIEQHEVRMMAPLSTAEQDQLLTLLGRIDKSPASSATAPPA